MLVSEKEDIVWEHLQYLIHTKILELGGGETLSACFRKGNHCLETSTLSETPDILIYDTKIWICKT